MKHQARHYFKRVVRYITKWGGWFRLTIILTVHNNKTSWQSRLKVSLENLSTAQYRKHFLRYSYAW